MLKALQTIYRILPALMLGLRVLLYVLTHQAAIRRDLAEVHAALSDWSITPDEATRLQMILGRHLKGLGHQTEAAEMPLPAPTGGP